MKASDLLVTCLEEEGIEYIFGVPGEENADFMISLEKSEKIRFILTRHEQGAAFMAEIYGRLTGNPAGALSTLGPGATNLITGVADSNMDRAPMLVLTGQGSTDRLHKGSEVANVGRPCSLIGGMGQGTLGQFTGGPGGTGPRPALPEARGYPRDLSISPWCTRRGAAQSGDGCGRDGDDP